MLYYYSVEFQLCVISSYDLNNINRRYHQRQEWNSPSPCTCFKKLLALISIFISAFISAASVDPLFYTFRIFFAPKTFKLPFKNIYNTLKGPHFHFDPTPPENVDLSCLFSATAQSLLKIE